MEAVLYLLLLSGGTPSLPPPPVQPVSPIPIVQGYPVTPVITTATHSGFFSVNQYKGNTYAGTYCLNCGGADLKHFTLSHKIETVRESVYDLYPDPISGILFISAENSGGRVYTWNGFQRTTFWQDPAGVNDPLLSTLATRRIFGQLVTLSGKFGVGTAKKSACWIHGVGRPYLPSSDGKFLRDIVAFKGKALIVGFDYVREVGGWYESTDLRNWTWRDVWPNMRFLRAKVAENGNKLYLAGSPYSGGVRHGPGALIQTYTTNPADIDLAQTFPCEMVFGFDVDPYSGAVYVGGHMGWRETVDKAQIWRYHAGYWALIVPELPEAETPAMMITPDGLYVSTRQEGGHGKVYLVK